MRKLIGNGGVDEQEEVVEDERNRKETRQRRKGRKSIGEKKE